MTAQRFALTLVVRGGKTPVAGELVADIDQSHIDAHETQWKPYLARYGGPRGDGGWDWAAFIRETRAESPTGTFLFAVEARSRLQGLMIAQTRRDLKSDLSGEPLLYVAYLAAAPWNRGDFRRASSSGRRPPQALAGVGEALVTAAAEKSFELGWDGRVGLHSLDAAVDFYVRNCHFTYLGKHASRLEDDAGWCELPALSAMFFVMRRSGT